MDRLKAIDYLRNCFWMLAPILAFNLAFTRSLPPAYQMVNFWKQIPLAIALPENILRAAVMMLPLFMHFSVSTSRQKLGFTIYLTGLLVYFASWAVLIIFPRSTWSTSAIGFMAPAYTPVIWLTGIALVGNELQFPRIALPPWIYGSFSVCFLLFHNMHAGLVYSRGN